MLKLLLLWRITASPLVLNCNTLKKKGHAFRNIGAVYFPNCEISLAFFTFFIKPQDVPDRREHHGLQCYMEKMKKVLLAYSDVFMQMAICHMLYLLFLSGLTIRPVSIYEGLLQFLFTTHFYMKYLYLNLYFKCNQAIRLKILSTIFFVLKKNYLTWHC